MLLQTKRLQVSIPEPHTFPNTTYRFDRAGFVASVMLDGRYEFCTHEPNNLFHPSSGGVGLCNEYLFPQACSEATIGEYFTKFGIGLFRKPDEQPFCFFKQYDAKFFAITWKADEHSITFITDPLPYNGYAVVQTKTLSVDQNRLTMSITLSNQGEKFLEMREFCHNFVTIDHKTLGSGYKLDIPALKDRGDAVQKGTVCGNGRGYSFSGYNSRAALINVSANEIEDVGTFTWILRHTESPARIRSDIDFKPDGIDLWCIDHIISVEAFRSITLNPGESTSWTRQWTFYDELDNE